MRRGEIRHARRWNYVGHEATGNRPCLIISPDWFNSAGNAIIAPRATGAWHNSLPLTRREANLDPLPIYPLYPGISP